jgi:hypothetical protein
MLAPSERYFNQNQRNGAEKHHVRLLSVEFNRLSDVTV